MSSIIDFLMKVHVFKNTLLGSTWTWSLQNPLSYFQCLTFPSSPHSSRFSSSHNWFVYLHHFWDTPLSIVNQVFDIYNMERPKQSHFQFSNSFQLSKSHRLPFALFNSWATSPFEFIHIDLWGTLLVIFITGYRYFVLFIYDHTRFTWFYLLKLKMKFIIHFFNLKSLLKVNLMIK